MEYNDSYPTCANTDCLFRLSSDEISPDKITEILGVTPTSIRVKGELRNPKRPESVNISNCWYLGSKNHITSKDCRRHLDWIIENLIDKKEQIYKLNKMGVEMSICCTWESAENQGGPAMNPDQMGPLAELGIPVWWEVWLGEE